MSKFVLYGNGIDDDYPAIQELLDARRNEVVLPIPEKNYLISKTLKIHSGQSLKLSPYTLVRLKADSNCAMLEDDDFATWKENICVDGGIWDMDNINQEPNPWHFAGKDGKTAYDRLNEANKDFHFSKLTVLPDVYTGFCMRFCRVNNFVMKNVTFRNPVTYGVQVSYMTNFTFTDIIFDYNQGAPKLWNMDGIHIEGNCKFGYIHNVKGACHDDLVAITADDCGPYGPISDIVVDGVFAEKSHSAVRLLSHGQPVKNIKICNVYGSYYVYGIGITKYYGGLEERGYFENITIDNVSACLCEGTKDVPGGKCPLIWVENGLDFYGLSITNVYRTEEKVAQPTIGFGETIIVQNLIINNVHLINKMEEPIEHLRLQGTIKDAIVDNIFVDKVKL